MSRKTSLLPLSLLVVSLVAGASEQPKGQAGEDKAGEIDKIFAWATPATPGCAVAVSHHGKLVVNRAYGLADLERDVPITPATVFDAGSLTKQFVAAAVLLLVEDKRVSLTDDIRAFIPELPDTGHKVTVDHLLTHTSGVRDWTGILPLAGGNTDALTLVLRQRGLNFAPGEEWSYSNSGYVLLKEMVARIAKMSFGEFARTRLFEPLGMKTTAYREDMRVIVKNRALAYDKEITGWKLAMLLDNDRGGGGGLLTTAGDLIIWNDALTSNRLGAFVTDKLQEPARLNNGRTLSYGRGLFLDANRGGKVLWHTGSAAGYKSLLSRFPEQGLSIAILCNSGDDTDRTMFARRIFDLFVPGTRERRAEADAPAAAAGGAPNAPSPDAKSLDPKSLDLKSKEGLFFNERTGVPLRLIVDGPRLRIAGGPPLAPLAADRFRRVGTSLSFMSADAFELHFQTPDAFDLKSMDGHTTRYRRAQPYAPTPADLKAFDGRYESDEIGTVLQIAAGETGLVARLEYSPTRSLEFRPIDRDTFQRGMMIVRFHRDETGKVVGFGYSNPLLRNIKFTRLNARIR